MTDPTRPDVPPELAERLAYALGAVLVRCDGCECISLDARDIPKAHDDVVDHGVLAVWDDQLERLRSELGSPSDTAATWVWRAFAWAREANTQRERIAAAMTAEADRLLDRRDECLGNERAAGRLEDRSTELRVWADKILAGSIDTASTPTTSQR